MKKDSYYMFFFIVLFISCNDSFDDNSQKVQDAISFSVLIEEESDSYTKGALISSVDDTSFTTIGVYAYNSSATSPIADSDYYLNNERLDKQSSGEWLFPRTYFWPGLEKLNFLAYSPYTSSSTNGITIGTDASNIPNITYKVPSLAVEQPDLMVAVAVSDISRVQVPIKMTHMLASVGFTVTAPDIVIDSIWISGVITQGTISVNYVSGAPDWTSLGAVDTGIYSSGLVQGATATPTDSTVMALDGYLMMIPQTLTSEATLSIKFENYDVKTYVLNTNAVKSWQAGQTYMYNLKEGTYDFDVTVNQNEIPFTGGEFDFTITSTYSNAKGVTTDIPWSVGVPSGTDTLWLNGYSDLGGTGGVNQTRSTTVTLAPYTITPSSVNDQLLQEAPFRELANKKNLTNVYGSYNSANTYTINGPGWYYFPCTVMGNAIKGTTASDTQANNTECFLPSTSSTPYVNYKGEAITTINDLNLDVTGASVELIWQDAPQLITEVSLIESNQYIQFYVDSVTIRQGNALIAIKDSDGAIMWSWQIWVTTQALPFAGVTAGSTLAYPLGTCFGGRYVYPKREIELIFKQADSNNTKNILVVQQENIMDAWYNASYYQWGRKDPFIGSDSLGVTKQVFGTQPIISAGPVSVNTAINNPNTFYTTTTSGTWVNGISENLWNVSGTNTKSIYDPSPAGFRVPLNTSITNVGTPTTSVSNGFNQYLFTLDLDGVSNNVTIWPFGYRTNTTDVISDYNSSGYYWLANQDAAGAMYYFNFPATPYITTAPSTGYGYCVKVIAE